MREVTGDLWAYENRKGFKLCIPVNGFIKNNGWGVTGAGVARQAQDRYPEFPRLLGLSLQTRGNVVSQITPQLLAFPVKHEWMQDADIELIEESAKELARRAREKPNTRFILPRPGCGNGRLSWKLVKPVLKKHLGELENVFVISLPEERENDGRQAGNRNGKVRA